MVQDDYRKSHGPVNGEYGGLSAVRKKKKIKHTLAEEDPFPAAGRTRAQTGGAQSVAPSLGSYQAAGREKDVDPTLDSGQAVWGEQYEASSIVSGEVPVLGSWQHNNLHRVIPSQGDQGVASLPMKVEEAIHNEEDPLGGRNEKVHDYTLLPL